MAHNRTHQAERIETADGVGYLYGGRMYSEAEYNQTMNAGGNKMNYAAGGDDKKKSKAGPGNVKPKGAAGEDLSKMPGANQMLRGPSQQQINQPPAGTEVQTGQQGFGYLYKDSDPEFYKLTQAPLTEGNYNTWIGITQNDQSLFPTVKRARLEWLGANSPKALPNQQQPEEMNMLANMGQTPEQVQLPTQIAGVTTDLSQQQQTPAPKMQKYMGKEAPVVDAGSFTDAMRQFASSTQDPTGKVFWWNGKAYKYNIAKPSAETSVQKKPQTSKKGLLGKAVGKMEDPEAYRLRMFQQYGNK